MNSDGRCPDCEATHIPSLTRRQFVKTVGATAAVASMPIHARAADAATKKTPETLVKKLHDSLTPEQKQEICFDWDHKDDGDLLRSHISANGNITDPTVISKFYNNDQQELIEAIFYGLYHPDWRSQLNKQLRDDSGGYGKEHSIAIFGEPGTEKFQFVFTGRHLTVRCDGNSDEHAAFGGPIVYGHAASGFKEKPDHPGNVFWHQARVANKLYQMLDGKQRTQALVKTAPEESDIHFRGAGSQFDGIPITELAADQKEHVQKVLQTLVEPYRTSDQDEAISALKAQGGLDKCSIAFYQSDEGGDSLDLGGDEVWDVWRLEGPSFVWHYRGAPHIHVWVNVASDPAGKIAAG